MIDTGIKPCKILLPNTDDYYSWACIACDQFTGNEKYWSELEKTVAGKKTTLDFVLPEIYLKGDIDSRIKQINANIENSLNANVFRELDEGFILTVRETPFVKRRIGLVGAVDLEKYEYKKKFDSLVRATEGTIEERIPPRLKIRENASVEFSHIMILFDDERKETNENLYTNRNNFQKVYDFTLNMGGGKIEGYYIRDTKKILEAFSSLADEKRLTDKYGKADNFVFAVGDGNHSLATAKAHWENVKKTLTEEEKQNHPARYALAEFVNIYDDGIYFEPIYRYVSNINTADFIAKLKSVIKDKTYIYYGKNTETVGENKNVPHAIKCVDDFIKEYIAENGGVVDYIHGKKDLETLVDSDGTSVGILFDAIDKSELFRYVSTNGAFPRKTFSMGEGIEKRYYLEGRKIKQC